MRHGNRRTDHADPGKSPQNERRYDQLFLCQPRRPHPFTKNLPAKLPVNDPQEIQQPRRLQDVIEDAEPGSKRNFQIKSISIPGIIMGMTKSTQ